MLLKDSLPDTGEWLYRWRSFVPLVMAPVVVIAIIRQGRLRDTGVDDLIGGVAVAIALIGAAIRAHVIGYVPPGTSVGSTRALAAADLNTTGFYSLVRHPLYLANLLMWLGVGLFTRDLLATAAMALFFAVYYERIMLAEERFLEGRFGDRLREWAAKTPAIFPKLSGYVSPARPFDWQAMLAREYSAWFALLVLFGTVAGGERWVEAGAIRFHLGWTIALGLATAGYLVMVYIKLGTTLLRRPR